MIVKTNAIVLRSVDFQESSQIVTLFTEKKGKLAVIAKGSRRPKSKFAAMLVNGQILEVLFYYKSTRSVQTLSDASYIYKLESFRTDLEKIALVQMSLELCDQLLHEMEINQPFFDYLTKVLNWLNNQQQVQSTIFPYLQIRFAQQIGIGLQMEEISTKQKNGYLNIENGTLSNESSGAESVDLNPAQFAFIKESLHSMNSSIFNMITTKKDLKELIQYLDRYFRYHVDGVRPRRSDAIFEQILNL